MDSMVLAETSTRQTVPCLPLTKLPRPVRVLLIIMKGTDAPQILDFGDRQFLTLGRAEPADVCVRDPGVSRLHARFQREQDGIRVTDLGSRNGTWFNGASCTDALLKNGDCVVLGTTTVCIQTPAPSAAGSREFDSLEAVSDPGLNLRASLQEHEASLIRSALQATGGNQRRAAALLQLPLRTFERKLRNANLRKGSAAESADSADAHADEHCDADDE